MPNNLETLWIIVIDVRIYSPFQSPGNFFEILLKLSVCYMKIVNAF